MKKLLSLAMAAAMCLTLTACGNGGTSTPQSSQPNPSNSSNSSVIGGADSSTEIVTTDSDLAYIQNKGTLIVGITEFEPMDYQNSDGEWIGFDADLAKAFAESLGVEVKFQVIDWSNKVFELDGETIDVVWNGMTLTDDVKALMSTSEPYCLNGQVVVVNKAVADQYQTKESLSALKFAVENGSAGAEQLDELNIPYTAMQNQAAALMEVASGASDAAVNDLLMAGAMIGEGTSYPDLTYTVQLNDEEYGVGFRLGSDLVEAFNDWWKEAYDAGTVMETAKTYGVQESIIEK